MNTYQYKMSKCFSCLLILTYLTACKKMVEIPPPNNSLTSAQVFADSGDAAAAVAGIYGNIIYNSGRGNMSFCNGSETIICGLSSDELLAFRSGQWLPFYSNQVHSRMGDISIYFWQQPYTFIYQANACIEGMIMSNLRPEIKNQFNGEAKFLRALFYFYLANYFGDVPYITSTDWRITNTVSRTNKDSIFRYLLVDLKDAQTLLRDDYSFSGGERTRANKQAATALLSRLYLYLKDWNSAESEASRLINNNEFSLSDHLDDVFSVASTEAILQWQLSRSFGSYNTTAEGSSILPIEFFFPPSFFLSHQLLEAFEAGDERKVEWVSQSEYEGTTYLYPYKYKVGLSQRLPNAPLTEYYTVLRLAEQYLIRAEARAQQGNLTGATEDLNMIRNRAGLPNTTASTQEELLDAILQERRIELFAEWGHRWFDLKRTGKIDEVMSVATPLKNAGTVWQSYQQWYPIPQSQLEVNPFLTQNPGYN